jgi:hypothetical protein
MFQESIRKLFFSLLEKKLVKIRRDIETFVEDDFTVFCAEILSAAEHKYLEFSQLMELRRTVENVEQTTNHLEGATQMNAHIVNFSDRVFSEHEFELIEKGLSFIPYPSSKPSYNEFNTNLNELKRSLSLKMFFDELDAPEISDSVISRLPIRSNFTPDKEYPNVNEFITAVDREAKKEFAKCKYKKTLPKHNNITEDERKIINNISKDSQIVIRAADKGGKIVILSSQMYEEKCMDILSDTMFYRKVSRTFMEKAFTEFDQSVKSVSADLPVKVKMWLSNSPNDCGIFYILPKIHKIKIPGRPILANCGSKTERLSIFINECIKHLPPLLPSYVRDTFHFVSLIQGLSLPSTALLATADIVSLYPNVSHQEGIEDTLFFYNNCDIKPLSPKHLEIAMKAVLTNNFAEFNNNIFQQIKGIAMGTPCATSIASLKVGREEIRFLEDRVHRKLPIPYLYLRFLDDIFLIWLHNRESLVDFFSELNLINPNLKFTFEISDKSVNYLDVTVFKDNDTLQTEIYRKPTDAPSNLLYDSCHPEHVRKALPYSAAARILRICSTSKAKSKHLNIAKLDFLRRGYPIREINSSFARAEEKLLEEQRIVAPHEQETSDAIVGLESEDLNEAENSCMQSDPNRCIFVSSYHPLNPNISKIFKKYLPQLNSNNQSTKFEPPLIAHKNQKNLKSSFARSKFPQLKAGSGPCMGRSNCLLCTQMVERTTAKATASNFIMKIEDNFNCTSRNVVYLLECKKCKQQYVGETENFRNRMNNHRSQCYKNADTAIYAHRTQTGHDFNDCEITILKGGFRGDRERWKFERFAIEKFNTYNKGINMTPGRIV